MYIGWWCRVARDQNVLNITRMGLHKKHVKRFFRQIHNLHLSPTTSLSSTTFICSPQGGNLAWYRKHYHVKEGQSLMLYV